MGATIIIVCGIAIIVLPSWLFLGSSLQTGTDRLIATYVEKVKERGGCKNSRSVLPD